jgi:HPr kinase/phosphorylase
MYRGMRPIRILGVLVSVRGVGILLLGAAGVRKSMVALSLMRNGHRLIADDLVEIFSGPEGQVVGRGVEEDVRIEVRGLGIYHAGSIFPDGTARSSPIDLVVELDEYDPARDLGRTRPETGEFRLLDSNLLKVRVPVPGGADASLLVEIVARLFEQK